MTVQSKHSLFILCAAESVSDMLAGRERGKDSIEHTRSAKHSSYACASVS